MNFKIINRYIASIIFILTLILYCATSQSSVAFWDCGEYAATSPAMEVPHPPGNSTIHSARQGRHDDPLRERSGPSD